MTDEELIKRAGQVRQHAYAPYSHFKVGAALLARDGRIFTGCNVENASYGLTICAERAAIFKAISEGALEFVKIALVTDTEELTAPCGACRQVISEFSSSIIVIMANLKGDRKACLISELLPHPFDKSLLR